jgi:hypothetical protein
MPENAHRMWHLRLHGVQSHAGRTPELARALRLHPDWPLCTAGCGWPLDPAAAAGGHTTHPGC